MSSSQYALLGQRRFAPFFATQSLGALNDNVFKNALVVMLVAGAADAAQRDLYANLAPALFILPFFLFSAIAGQLADKYDRAMLIRAIKVFELLVMILAAIAFLAHATPWLFVCLFLMGVHSTLFGPIKYAILPQVLRSEELVGGNALVETATSLAILVGILLGGVLISLEGGPGWAGATVCALAALGVAAAWAVPAAPAPDPALRVSLDPFTTTARNLRFLARERVVFLSCLGISWFWFYGSVFIAQLPTYAVGTLGGDPAVITWLLALFSVGVGAGSLLCERLSGHKVEIGLVPFGSIGMTLFGADLAFATPAHAGAVRSFGEILAAPGGWRMAIDLVGIGVFAGFFIVPLFALVQQRAAPEARARIIAGNNILNAAFMVVAAAMAFGLLRAGLTVPQVFLVTAVLNAAVAIYIYGLVPEFLLRFLTWIFVHTLYRLRVRGLERIPDEGPVLLVCNHVSFMDPMILGGSVRRPVRFVMYYKIFQWWGLNWLFRTARAIPIAGAKEDPAMMERAFEEVDRELAAGQVVAIFPEGGITRDGDIARFRPGVERILARRPVPVVPMALRGMWGSLFSRRDRLRFPRRFRARIELEIGAPVPPGEADAQSLEAKVRELRGDRA